jgi:hypothetical protein
VLTPDVLSRLAIAPNTPTLSSSVSVAASAEVRACLPLADFHSSQRRRLRSADYRASQLSCFWQWSDVRHVNQHKSARSDRILSIGFVTLLIAGHCYFFEMN